MACYKFIYFDLQNWYYTLLCTLLRLLGSNFLCAFINPIIVVCYAAPKWTKTKCRKMHPADLRSQQVALRSKGGKGDNQMGFSKKFNIWGGVINELGQRFYRVRVCVCARACACVRASGASVYVRVRVYECTIIAIGSIWYSHSKCSRM